MDQLLRAGIEAAVTFLRWWLCRRAEAKFEKMHRERVRKYMAEDPDRLRRHLIGQMQILSKKGVIPSWENFTQFGNSWKHMRKYFSAKDQKKYEEVWTALFKETCHAWTEVERSGDQT